MTTPVSPQPPSPPAPATPMPRPALAREEAASLQKPDSLHAAPASKAPVRLFFFADAHSKTDLTQHFVDEANRIKPSLVVEGGDTVHDGTHSEFKRAYDLRARLQVPLRMVTGNHDAELRGPHPTPPPQLPTFQSFDHQGIHVILIDNHDQTIPEADFRKLEADLKANKGKPTLVAMHVPPFLSQPSSASKLGKILPLVNPDMSMKDPAQVKRFTQLMTDHGVLAVLSGHTHEPDYAEKGGVKYIVAGPTGGLAPGPSVQHEYLDITVNGRDVQVTRVPLKEAPGNFVGFVQETAAFYTDINGTNHAAQGWNYVPSGSVQVKGGLKATHKDGQMDPALTVTGELERELDDKGKKAFNLDATAAVGPRELSLRAGAGFKYRPLGDYNHNLYVSGNVGLNAGIVGGDLSAGIGIRPAIGYEYKNLTVEVAHEFATNHQATTLSLGYRF